MAPVNPAPPDPSRNALTERMPCTRKFAASRWLASTSTLASSTRPARADAAFSSAGESALQGPHHSAQKSTTTGSSRERCSTFCSNSASPTSKTACVSGDMQARLLEDDRAQRRTHLTALGVAERIDARRRREPLDDLAEHGVVRREAGVGAGHDVELAAGGAGGLLPGLGHGHHALRVLGS